MGKDRLFNEFMDNTGLLRLRGFQAYIASLVLFMAQLTLIMAERAESPYVRYPVFISGALIAVYMYQDWDKIMKAATPIFLPQNDESVNN